MTLPELIAAIEAGPVTRELNDRVLLACGWQRRKWTKKGTTVIWKRPDGEHIPWTQAPSPLFNLQDATLAVPEGFNGRVVLSGQAQVAKYGDGWNDDDPQADIHKEPARALVLAALKARELEAEG